LEQFSLLLLPENQVYSVSELNSAVRSALESEFRDIRVAGEISGTRLATSGHCYFTLKELDSVVKCVCYRSAYRYLKVKPQDGLAVVVRGQLGVFEARGEYQIQVESLQPQGHGALQLAFEDLKKKLAAEGLFESARKRRLPAFPRRIGIVTSPKGAVISDMLHVFERRFPGLHIRLFPALVQGEGSIDEVCRGIRYFGDSKWADLIIVARGGGSLEDLWTFNTEAVARAIAASPVPSISAVGHETDVTIADFVADFRAPTPSAAAEVACFSQSDLLQKIGAWEGQIARNIRFRLAEAAHRLQKKGVERAVHTLGRAIARKLQLIDDLDYRLRQRVRGPLDEAARRLRELEDRLRRCDHRPRLERTKARLDTASVRLRGAMEVIVSVRRKRLEASASGLKQLNPLAVLERGYAVVQTAEGRLVREAAEAPAGADIRVRLGAGRLDAVVTQSHSE
jgi:exodeoxyribonuclease VII large subunit